MTKQQQFEDVYTTAHLVALTRLERVREMIENMPDPENAEWGHVGNLGRINQLLNELLGDAE